MCMNRQNENRINWLVEQYPLIYLINELKPFLKETLYTGKDNSIAIAKFAPHFNWKNLPINIDHWNKTKSVSQKTNAEIYNSINLIISQLEFFQTVYYLFLQHKQGNWSDTFVWYRYCTLF